MNTIPLQEKCVDILISSIGISHNVTLANINWLGQLYRSAGNHQHAVELLKSSLNSLIELVGEAHSNTLTVMNNLAMVYKELENYEEALHLYERFVQQFTIIYGESHPQTLMGQNNLFQVMKQYDEAIKLYEVSYQTALESLGSDHAVTIGLLSNWKYCLQISESHQLLT
jgi:tetratricopeptide (TPR) repeat protein